MRFTRKSFLGVLAAAAGAPAQQPATSTAGKTHLKVGDTAPDFTLSSSTGKPITLSSFRGKSNVVVAFFPAAFTGG